VKHTTTWPSGTSAEKLADEEVVGKLTNEVAVVTGVSKGMGESIANDLAAGVLPST
jgi:hypothetical protein